MHKNIRGLHRLIIRLFTEQISRSAEGYTGIYKWYGTTLENSWQQTSTQLCKRSRFGCLVHTRVSTDRDPAAFGLTEPKQVWCRKASSAGHPHN